MLFKRYHELDYNIPAERKIIDFYEAIEDLDRGILRRLYFYIPEYCDDQVEAA